MKNLPIRILSLLFCFLQINAICQVVPNSLIQPTVVPDPIPIDIPSPSILNTIKTTTLKCAVKVEASIGIQKTNVEQSIVFLDGLGRPVQTVAWQAGGNYEDIYSVNAYDEFGRELKSYLPFPDPNGSVFNLVPTLLQGAFVAQNAYYNATYPNDKIFYSKVKIDENSLNGYSKQLGVGNVYVSQNKGASSAMRTNDVLEDVKIFTVDPITNLPVVSGAYPSATLYVQEIIDVDGKMSLGFKTFEGDVVMQKAELTSAAAGHSGWLCTYNVIDEMGRLRYMIPPKAVEYLNTNSWVITQAIIDELCYYYEYDELGRLTSKKLPGQSTARYVYDKFGNIGLSQDGNMALANKWAFTKQDDFGRKIVTGIFLNASNKSQVWLQTEMDNVVSANAFIQFLNQKVASNIWTTTSTINDADIYNLAYFDNYNQAPINMQYNDVKVQAMAGGMHQQIHVLAKDIFGKPTVQFTRILNGLTITTNWTSAVTYFDEKGHAIQTYASNHKGGIDMVTMRYNFSGLVLSSLAESNNPSSTNMPNVTMAYNTKYDWNLKPMYTLCDVNNSGITRRINNHTYNKMGQLLEKELGFTTEKQTFSYRPSGNLEAINKDFCETGIGDNLYGEILSYDYGFTQNQLNGFKSGLKWRFKGSGAIQRAYGYTYDAVGKLLSADYTQNDGSGWNNTLEDYTAKNMSYDANGNMLHMDQWITKLGIKSKMDDMTYTYGNGGYSNKLKTVSDAITTKFDEAEFMEYGNVAGQDDYNYDANGNITKDNNKNITSIAYNYFGKATLINFTNNRSVAYQYNASGMRLSKTTTEGTIVKVTDYVNGIEYDDNILSSIPHAEGRIRIMPNGTTYDCEFDYFIKDHMGNIRTIATEDFDGLVDWDPIPPPGPPVIAPGNPGGIVYKDIEYSQHLAARIATGNTTNAWRAYRVTNEIANQTQENNTFDNVDATRDTRQGSIDPANQKETRLNGGIASRRVGPSMVLRVMAGDKFTINTSAMYNSGDQSNNGEITPLSTIVNSLFNVLNNTNSAMNFTEGTGQFAATENAMSNSEFLTALQNIKNENTINGNKPQAFLNYVLLDDNMNVVGDNSGIVQTTEPNTWNELSVAENTAQANGYLYVFLSNEDNMDVHFDNIIINHYKGELLQENHYYPYGLTITTKYQMIQTNKILWGSKLLEKEEFANNEGLNWYNYDVRPYDPQIGRWHNPDILLETSPYISPYSYCDNNPVNYTDPSGMKKTKMHEGGGPSIDFGYWGTDGKYHDKFGGSGGSGGGGGSYGSNFGQGSNSWGGFGTYQAWRDNLDLGMAMFSAGSWQNVFIPTYSYMNNSQYRITVGEHNEQMWMPAFNVNQMEALTNAYWASFARPYSNAIGFLGFWDGNARITKYLQPMTKAKNAYESGKISIKAASTYRYFKLLETRNATTWSNYLVNSYKTGDKALSQTINFLQLTDEQAILKGGSVFKTNPAFTRLAKGLRFGGPILIIGIEGYSYYNIMDEKLTINQVINQRTTWDNPMLNLWMPIQNWLSEKYNPK
jgi:RHS repeat-associated protein